MVWSLFKIGMYGLLAFVCMSIFGAPALSAGFIVPLGLLGLTFYLVERKTGWE